MLLYKKNLDFLFMYMTTILIFDTTLTFQFGFSSLNNTVCSGKYFPKPYEIKCFYSFCNINCVLKCDIKTINKSSIMCYVLGSQMWSNVNLYVPC